MVNNLDEYPPFLPSGDYTNRSPQEWTAAEAKVHYNWFLEVLEERTDALLVFFGEEFDFNFCRMLDRLGCKIVPVLRMSYRVMGPFGDASLVEPALSMCIDMGMLIARCLLLIPDIKCRWILCKRGKTYIDYNQPVLLGFPDDPKYGINPCGLSVNLAHGIVRGTEGPSLWREIFEHNRARMRGMPPIA